METKHAAWTIDDILTDITFYPQIMHLYSWKDAVSYGGVFARDAYDSQFYGPKGWEE